MKTRGFRARQNFDIMKKGGAHGTTKKAQRRADKVRLNKEW